MEDHPSHTVIDVGQELEKDDRELRDFVDHAPLGICWLAADGAILAANQAELELLGYTREEYVGRNIADFHRDRQVVQYILGRLRKNESIRDYEARVRAKDGATKHVLITANALFENERMKHARCFTRDITDRKRAEEAVLHSQRRLQLISDVVPHLLAYIDPQERYQSANQAHLTWFGIHGGSLTGKTLVEVLGREAYAAIEAHVASALAGHAVSFEAALEFRYGGMRHIEASFTPHLDAKGTVEGFVALFFNISERKRTEAMRESMLRRTERLTKITAAIADAVTHEQVLAAVVDGVSSALDASSAALWMLDADQKTARMAHSFGYNEEKKRMFGAWPIDASPSFPALDTLRSGEPLWIDSQEELLVRYPNLHAAISPGRSYRIACLPLAVHGRTLGVLAMTFEGAPPLDMEERGFLMMVAGYATQALERLRLLESERKSREEAELLYSLVRALIEAEDPDAVFASALEGIESALGARRSAILVFDRDGVMRFKAWRELSVEYRRAVEGHSPWVIDARDPQPIIVRDVEEEPIVSAFLPQLREERIAALGFIPLLASGRLLGKMMVYYDEARGLSPGALELARAIADHVAATIARFEALRELQEAVRFNEMFTAILGHDLRNPLNAIMNAAHLLSKRSDGDRGIKPIARILSSSERMARMIDQLLDFTRTRIGDGIPIHAEATDLLPVLKQVIEELDDANPEWKLHLRYSGHSDGVWDADRLSQVFSNLIGNAIQHGVAEHGVHVFLDGTAPEVVTIEVKNIGVVPAELLPHLFEPMSGGGQKRYKSTGLGLGLFISQRIAGAHGGRITARSSEEEGTCFVVELPRGSVK